jgi:hypothetical protein
VRAINPEKKRTGEGKEVRGRECLPGLTVGAEVRLFQGREGEAPRCSTRGDQAAVCVHIDTQSSGFGRDEAHFALQTEVECRAAD